jgi:hypothetical protein
MNTALSVVSALNHVWYPPNADLNLRHSILYYKIEYRIFKVTLNLLFLYNK